MQSSLAAALLLSAAVGAAAPAQTFHDPFNHPPSTTISGYTEQRGDWMALGTAVQSNASTTFQELTYDSITALDCCVETVCNYDSAAPQLQYCGPIARYTGSGASANFFMVKVQDNSTPYDGWDRAFVYYHSPGFGSVGIPFYDITPTSKQTRVRLQVVDQGAMVLVQVWLDTDNDGKWDHAASAMTANHFGKAGRIGVNGYRNAIVDDLRFFDVPLWLAGPAQIGTTVAMPGRGTANHGYVGACSLSRGAIPIGGGRAVPLAADPLFFTTFPSAPPSVFSSFQGFCDPLGDFAMGLAIPKAAGLVGATIYASGVTYDRTGITGICPDVEVTFQP